MGPIVLLDRERILGPSVPPAAALGCAGLLFPSWFLEEGLAWRAWQGSASCFLMLAGGNYGSGLTEGPLASPLRQMLPVLAGPPCTSSWLLSTTPDERPPTPDASQT